MARWSLWYCFYISAAIAATKRKASAFLIKKNVSPSASIHRTNRLIDGIQRQSSSSINPNDMETPEERAKRMELVRTLQKSFYQDEEGITKNCDGVFEDVPLWRVQWTELPGYQNVLNCHVPHYTHMFMKILNGPQPWYFGHVFLPGGSENLDNPEYRLCGEHSKAAHVGTLMKVSDYKQLEDGRLLLIAQALAKFEILQATQHLPYAIAKVQLVPDQELVDTWYDDALKLLLTANKQQQEGGGGDTSEYDITSACWDAARVGAVTEAMHWESFEYRNVAVDECLEGGAGVSPIANFDATRIPVEKCDVIKVMNDHLSDSSRERTTTKDTTTSRPANSLSDCDNKRVLELEREVWISVDFMIQLLAAINTNPSMHIPVPTQLLGLLPSDVDWPEGFQLHTYATTLSKGNATIGTMSKSPFVEVDTAAPLYPNLRRAQRLSFIIWSLMDGILAGYSPAEITRQSVLELNSTTERLEAAKRGLDAINTLLRQTLEGKRR